MSLVFASSLALPDAWFDEVAAAVPSVRIERPGARIDEWPADLRAEVDLVHTVDASFDVAPFERLRCVQLDTSGVDHIVDSALWSTTAVPVTTLGGVAPVPMAEYTLMGLLALTHHLPALVGTRAARSWPPAGERLARFTPSPLPGSTVCIVGYGRIGGEIARLCHSLGMHVIGVRRSTAERLSPLLDLGRRQGDDPTEVVALDRLDEALGRADHVVLVLPLTDGTRGLFDSARLDAMRPGATMINVARGGIVDESALLERIRSGRISGAVIDVFETEPLPPDSPWWTEERVIATPHVAGLAPDYLAATRDLIVQNLQRLEAGEPLMNEVDRASGY